MSEPTPKAKKAQPRFVNLQPSNVTVFDENRCTVVVCPYSGPRRPDGTYVVEGEHYQQFVSDRGPLWPFPEAPDTPRGLLAPTMVLPSQLPKGTLLTPTQARVAAIGAQSEPADEAGGADPADGEGSQEGEGGSLEGETPIVEEPAADPVAGELVEDAGDAEDATTPAAEPVDVEEESEEPVTDFQVIKSVGPDLDAAIKANDIATFEALATAPIEALVAIPGISDNNVDQIQEDAAVFASGNDPYANKGPAKKGLKGRARKGK